jgi:hypothetical protein
MVWLAMEFRNNQKLGINCYRLNNLDEQIEGVVLGVVKQLQEQSGADLISRLNNTSFTKTAFLT